MKKNIFAFCIAAVAFVVGFDAPAQGLIRRPQPQPAASSSGVPSSGTSSVGASLRDVRGRLGEASLPSDSSELESADPKEAPALNWDATPVDIVFQTYGEQVGKTILKDPAVPNATITLKSREGQKLTKEEYLEAIEVVLEMNGIHLEPYGEKFIRAVPRGKARKEGIPLYMDIADVPAEAKDGRVISVMISFKSIATDEAQKALENFKSDTGILNVFERTNSILVTDTWQNIKRMEEIARALDISSPVLEQVFVYQVENASASDIKNALEQIVQESQKEQEKNGKAVQNTTGYNPQSNLVRPSSLGAGRLLNRPNQPEQPKPLESTVTSMSDADRGMIRGKVLILADERSNKLVIITSKSNYDFFEKVIKQLDVETTPDTVVKVYRLKYAEAEEVADMINDLIGNAPSSKSSTKSNQNAAAKGQGGTTRVSTPTGVNAANATRKSANQRSGEAKPGELSKENTTVLADKRINGLVVMTNKELVPVIESIVEAMDVKLSQVLIETCIVEVTLGDDFQTGIDWVNNRWNGKDPLVSGGGGGGSGSSTLSQLVQTKSYSDWIKEARDAYGLKTDQTISDAQVQSYIKAAETYGASATPIGAGVTYLLKSEKLNISAVIRASKSDAHAKYLASPIVMTVDNKEATIEATEARKFFNGYETSNSYSTYVRTPKYDSKDIGITIKVTPKINPNGTVMLTVEEEYSQLGAGQSILVDNGDTQLVDTSLTRKMSADVLLDNMQTVILGGLTQTRESEGTTGIPILKDIPWIGKWLFGSVTQTESRNELLVFLTPYVLDDAHAAQAEAARRKSVLSDSSPWDDHGWSGSKLADPVPQKELMRRQKDEWKKQDEERRAKLALEAAKLERAKELEKMDKAERDLWLEMHKDELEKAERDDLESKMKSNDAEKQEELRKLVDELRAKNLQEEKKPDEVK